MLLECFDIIERWLYSYSVNMNLGMRVHVYVGMVLTCPYIEPLETQFQRQIQARCVADLFLQPSGHIISGAAVAVMG